MLWTTLLNRTMHARRSTRRLLILAAFTGYPLVQVGYQTLVASHRVEGIVWAPIAVLLMLATAIGLVTIWLFVRDRATLDGADLDERERALTSRAHTLSYGLLATFLVVVGGVLAIWLSFVGPLTLRMEEVAPWLIAVGLYLPVLPSAALAWIQPDAIEDEVAA